MKDFSMMGAFQFKRRSTTVDKIPELRIKKNRGAVLLIFMLLTITIGSALLLKSLNLGSLSTQEIKNRNVLVQAKESLLGYAMSFADQHAYNLPGYLPCPDTNGDGLANSPCGLINQSSLGRLPWKTLGIKPLRDSAGECLWYAVSGRYKESPQGSLSTDSVGQFLLFDASLNSLNGNNNSNAAIAVVFAVGNPLNGQNRSLSGVNATECGSIQASDGINRSSNYMETFAGINNANGSYASGVINGLTITQIPGAGYSIFLESASQPSQLPFVFNDSLIKITPIDFQPIYTYMQQWIGERVRQCLNTYANDNSGKLPWPALLETPGNPSFNDTADQRFGRVASNLTNSSIWGLSLMWPIDPMKPGNRCFNWSWWAANRENVFYAIDEGIKPGGTAALPVMTVDSIPESAVILVAGREWPGNQNRVTGIDKGTISNYLESTNIIDSGIGSIPPGNENFISNDNVSVFFNDYVCTLALCP